MKDDPLKRSVRRALSDPAKLAKLLGLRVHKNCGSYVMVCCPSHGERTASCSIRKTQDGVGVKCHSCQWTTDVFGLVAAVRGLDMRRDFVEVLATCAELASMHDAAHSLRRGEPVQSSAPPPPLEPEPEREYPPVAEVTELWERCVPVTYDADAGDLLADRGIDPHAVARMNAARVIPRRATDLPAWACFRGSAPSRRPWTETGHRLLVPLFDHTGTFRSVRAWLTRPAEGVPKRVPPSGCRSSGIVLANAHAVRWLRSGRLMGHLVIVEGEPDWLVRTLTAPRETVIGICSGSWTADLAARVPADATVVLMTHLDPAGERYASAVCDSLPASVRCLRWSGSAELGDLADRQARTLPPPDVKQDVRPMVRKNTSRHYVR